MRHQCRCLTVMCDKGVSTSQHHIVKLTVSDVCYWLSGCTGCQISQIVTALVFIISIWKEIKNMQAPYFYSFFAALHLNWISITTQLNLNVIESNLFDRSQFHTLSYSVLWTFEHLSAAQLLSFCMPVCHAYIILPSLGFLPTPCGWYDLAWKPRCKDLQVHVYDTPA